jgi:hypothetical protein
MLLRLEELNTYSHESIIQKMIMKGSQNGYLFKGFLYQTKSLTVAWVLCLVLMFGCKTNDDTIVPENGKAEVGDTLI